MTTPRVLICGSLAFDNIMVFDGHFKDHILTDQVHILNVAFLVPRLRKEWGGCAGNIAYNLQLLGGHPVPMATLGHDGSGYLTRFEELGIETSCVRVLNHEFTAQAFITTDLGDNQITAFHPGAMTHSHQNHISMAKNIALAIVAPDGREGMIEHAEQMAQAGIPFVFDPGQGLPMFGKAELMRFLELATYAAFNDYEARVLCDKTGLGLEELSTHVQALIVTRGAEGSHVYIQRECHQIPCVQARNLIDPTGCGDAYRAGLLYGLTQGKSILKAAKLASLMGALKIAHQGGQNHAPTQAEIFEQFQQEFDETF